MVDDWLERELVSGLSGLVALRLDGAPAADAITHTLDIWLVALKKSQRWDEHQDTTRIRSGFETLFASCERWPAPARLIREIPARIENTALPKPTLTEEQRANGRQKISEILNGLKHRTAKPQTDMEQEQP